MADANAGNSGLSRMRAVTISREYGSGGGEIATRLAKRLGWQLIDHEVVVGVAKALGVTEAEAEAHDEHVDSTVARMLSLLGAIQSPVPAALPLDISTDERDYDLARRKVVEGAFVTGNAVIVGRGAQVLLASHRDVLHVRVVAPLEQRIRYVMQREGLDRVTAQARIHAKDHDRARFLLAEHHQNPTEVHLYDLVVNTGVLDLDSVVDLLVLALQRKATCLDVPPEKLGPAAGMARYAEPPGSFGPEEEDLAGAKQPQDRQDTQHK
jgi:cytidylate kinase